MKALVTYFSHEGQNTIDFKVTQIKKGHTRVVAEKIAELTGADMLRILPKEEYPVDYEACSARAKAEHEGSLRPEIVIPLETLDAYDTIFIGFPIWYRSYPRVIASFVEKFDFTGKRILPFCTNEEGGFGMADMELGSAIKAKGGKVELGLSVRGKNADNCEDQIKRWLMMNRVGC